MNRSYEIVILGNRYKVTSDLNEEEVRRVEELVKKKLMNWKSGIV
ncbi:MAG: hypothetical protein OHK0040_12910 [bacterium]